MPNPNPDQEDLDGYYEEEEEEGDESSDDQYEYVMQVQAYIDEYEKQYDEQIPEPIKYALRANADYIILALTSWGQRFEDLVVLVSDLHHRDRNSIPARYLLTQSNAHIENESKPDYVNLDKIYIENRDILLIRALKGHLTRVQYHQLPEQLKEIIGDKLETIKQAFEEFNLDFAHLAACSAKDLEQIVELVEQISYLTKTAAKSFKTLPNTTVPTFKSLITYGTPLPNHATFVKINGIVQYSTQLVEILLKLKSPRGQELLSRPFEARYLIDRGISETILDNLEVQKLKTILMHPLELLQLTQRAKIPFVELTKLSLPRFKKALENALVIVHLKTKMSIDYKKLAEFSDEDLDTILQNPYSDESQALLNQPSSNFKLSLF